ncbi:RraA family protein [Actinoplanes subtropicus]|uniref:RraA family protein n=1 Tax=Actinoplanes subtropicus TaxID=543632 RepID=UPI0004C34428|nr:RraA family protein [Actinoplanes subtropicus]
MADLPQGLPTTTFADVLDRHQVMDAAIRPLWSPVPLIAGPAFTVRCPPGDNLMLHAAIYQAEPGSVIVVESGDLDYALAGGNVCAVARRRGVAGFVLDGLIRDIGEVRDLGFPVWGLGVIPVPGGKATALPVNVPIRCGGVPVRAGDLVVADEDGVVVVPAESLPEAIAAAAAKQQADAAMTLDDWEQAHRAKVDGLIAAWQAEQS